METNETPRQAIARLARANKLIMSVVDESGIRHIKSAKELQNELREKGIEPPLLIGQMSPAERNAYRQTHKPPNKQIKAVITNTVAIPVGTSKKQTSKKQTFVKPQMHCTLMLPENFSTKRLIKLLDKVNLDSSDSESESESESDSDTVKDDMADE